MNGKNLLEQLNGVNMTFVEESTYPEKKNRASRWTKMTATAACLATVLTLGTITYASGAVDAIRSYFSSQNSVAEQLLKSGEGAVTNGEIQMRVDNYIADQREFIFSVSLIGTGKNLTTSDALKIAWITRSGEKITEYNKEVGAYTIGSGWRQGMVAHADSMYEEADATFIVINEVPEGYTMEELEGVEVSCKDLIMEVEVGDSVIETYRLSSNKDEGSIQDFIASAIGFSYVTDSEDNDIRMIKADGTYVEDDGENDTEGYHGFWLSSSTSDDNDLFSIRGRWGGSDAIAIGILDLEQYAGICVNGVDYFFER